MGRPRQKDGEVATPARLLDAALVEFARFGYEGAKLAEIAERAGISRPSLLYHYSSKDELYGALVKKVLTDIGGILGAALGGPGDFRARLDAVIGAFGAFTGDQPLAARVILREVMDDRGPGHHLILEVGVPLIDAVERFIQEEGQGVISPELPVRQALLQVVSAAFLRSATGALEPALWGEGDHHLVLARTLFLGGNPR